MRKRNSRATSKAAVRSELPEFRILDSAVLESSAAYNSRCCEVAKAMRSRGASDAEICNALHIGSDTFLLWQEQFKEFADACARDGAAQKGRLQGRLYDLALGYSREEQKVVVVRGKQKVVTIRVEVPPNLEAIRLLLANNGFAEDGLTTLLREISESRTSRIGPVALRPEEEEVIAPFYGGRVPERAKGWLREEHCSPSLPAPPANSPNSE